MRMQRPLPIKYFIFLSALLFLVSPVAGLAAAGEGELPPSRSLTLSESYRLAVESHEAVGMAREGINQAESGVDKAVSQLLPKLTAEGGYTVYSEQKKSGGFVIQPDDASRVDVRLTQPVYTGGREWAAKRQAGIISERNAAGLDWAMENVIRAVGRAYYGVLKAEKEVEIKEAALKRAGERSKVASARLRVGEVTKSAVLRADALVAGAEAELIKARSDLKNTADVLKRLTNVNDDVKVSEPPVKQDLSNDVNEILKLAYAYRLDYKQGALDERAASEGVSYAKGFFLPSLRLEGIYSWREQNPRTTFYQKESVSGSIILSVPIFEGGLRYAELSEAKSKLRESELRRLLLKRDIELQVRAAFNGLESVKAALEAYRKQLSLAEEDYNMVFEQFKFGLATTVDVIDADATLISAQRSLMNSTYDLAAARLELRAAAGVLLLELKDVKPLEGQK
ncbi:MAG: TolC family protein [Deltaproteobacteria bacterium]|nr:TolC family protein [Deltaproteobacteria bacterium]